MKHLLLAVVILFSAQAARSTPLGAEVQSWHYDSVKGITTITIVNVSHKDISAFSVLVTVFYADGTTNLSEKAEDYLPAMLSVNEAGHPITPDQGNGAFAPGTIRELTTPESKPVQNVHTAMQVVVYADGTTDVVNQESLDRLVIERKGTLSGLQKANELLTKVLADPAEQHPSASARAEVQRLVNLHTPANDDLQTFEGMSLRAVAAELEHAPQSYAERSPAEEDYLRELIKRHENRIAAILPHTKLGKEVQP